MKKVLSIVLCLCLLLSLAACAGGSGAETTAAEESAFRVGYSKINLTPSQPVELSAYVSGRIYEDILDYVYLTCVAITDEKDNTLLMYTVDMLNMKNAEISNLKVAITAQVDIPEENIFFTCTHTHTAPSADTLGAAMTNAAIDSAKEALEDRKPAEMYFGKGYTKGDVSFVRHYTVNDGTIATVNHGKYEDSSVLTGHTHDADPEMRVLQFKREGGKDVVMVNWQCHPNLLGNVKRLSADIIGPMRSTMEQDLDCLFAYYQGGAGNINPNSYIVSEMIDETENYKMWGQGMANAAKEALKNMTQVPTGDIEVVTQAHIAKPNMEGMDPDTVAAATLVVEYYKAGNSTSKAKAYAESLNAGVYSYYHANDLLGRAGKTPKDEPMYISAIRIGDEFSWSTMPGEFFDTTVKFIREESPFTYNFATAYTNGSLGYVPTEDAWSYGSYEVDVTKVERGTAEAVQAKIVDMLDELHSK